MPHFPRMLKKTFVDGYDYLQIIVFANVIWCLAWIPAVLGATARVDNPIVKGIVVLVVAALGVGPVSMGLANLSKSIMTREDPRMAEMFVGIRRFFGRGVALFLVNVVFIPVCIFDAWWWSQHTPPSWGPVPPFVVTTLWIYVLLFWLIMQVYCAPFIVRENIGVWKALKKSALLVLDNLGYSTLVMLQVAVILAIMALWIILPGPQIRATLMGLAMMILFFILAGFVSLLGAEALDDLMQKYEEVEDEEEGNEGEGEDGEDADSEHSN